MSCLHTYSPSINQVGPRVCTNCGQPEQVTKEWLARKIEEDSQEGRVIGRALLAIYRNQTLSEQGHSKTAVRNGIGFCKPDARVGSIGARMFKSKARLEPWVIEIWTRKAKDGFPRICKYVEQLDSIREKHQLATTARYIRDQHAGDFNR